MRGKGNAGFTLIELMTVVVIVGILAMIAYPAYREQMLKTRRSDAEVALTDLANQEEQFFGNQNHYTASILSSQGPTNLEDLSTTSPKGFYTLGVWLSPTVTNRYVASATPTPTGPQAGDGTFYLSSNGQKTYVPQGGGAQVGWP